MHLKELSLTGFKAYPSSLRIQFSPHLTTITGSNGSGKSSIISAILFALNGTDSPSELVNNTCKSASVTLKFSNKTSVTRIYDKTTKVNKFKINDSTVTTQTYMKHLAELNLSETSFYSIQQGAVTKLVSMTKQQLCDFVKQMAGVKFYEEKACKAMIKLEEKEKSLLLNKKKINETISPFFYKLKQCRENHLNLQKKKESQNKIQELKKINYKKELKEIKEKIKLKIKLIKEEKKIEIENKFDLLKRKEEINQSIYKLNLEEMKEEFLKNKEEISKLKIIPDNYLKLQEKYNTLFSKEMNKYSEKTDNLIELLTNVKLSLENYSEKNTNNFDKNFINLLKELICKIEKNNFDLQEIEIKKIKEEENFIKNFEKIYRRKNEIKELIYQLKSNLNYPILEGVFGKVSENFTLKDEKYSVAIQSILGNKGSFVIVENEKIGSNLLNLDQPITVIPLNKIVTYSNKLTNHLCLIDCINFDSKVSNAMKYIFNNIYLANNKEMANEICYKNKCMAVLLDGTVYDPKGTMTVGGNFDQSKINFVENFLNLEDISFLEKYKFNNSEKILNSLENILKYKINSSIKGVFLLEKLLNFLEKNTFYLTNFNLINKLIDLIKEVKLLQEYENIKKLKNNVNEFKKLKKELEEEILVEHKKYVKNERIKNELNELESKLVKLEEKIKLAEVKKEELEVELEKLEEKINFCDEISKQEECRKEVIKSNFELKNEINQLIYKFNEIYEEAHEFIDDLEEKVKKSNEEIKDFCEKLKISPEKSKILLSRMSQNFNHPNIENLSEKLNDLLKEYEKVKDIKKYKIDPRNFDLLEKNEKILEELEKKISLLEIDKIKISSTLEKLNEASSKAEKKALIHLNTNLTKCIQYFLPNLEISINDSYNLKILQNKTEVSLNALSGGQRSLIALCYLFTALSYNPSIFYIFDEIDAALDVKYCSQIGEMLRKEIKAQFVVVSLRDEMANQGDLMLKVVLEENRPVVKQVSK